MYSLFKSLALRIMKSPTEPPDPPAGSHDNLQIYRASPSYLTYRLLVFWLSFSGLWLIPWAFIIGGALGRNGPTMTIGIVLFPILVIIQAIPS